MATEILVVGQTYMTTVYISTATQVAILRRYYFCGVLTGVPPTTQDFANFFDATLASFYTPLLENSARYRGVTVRRVSIPGPFPLEAVATTNAANGTAGGIALPKQCCGLISFQTGFIGKSNRGRQYVPFPASADDFGDGKPTTGAGSYISRLTNLGNALVNNMSFPNVGATGTALMNPVIWSLPHPTFRPIEDNRINEFWATQRRRGDFGRTNVSPI